MKKIIYILAAFAIIACDKSGGGLSTQENEPRLISIVPSNGHSGCTAIISGIHFSGIAEENKVTVDGIDVPVISATKNRLTVTMPAHEEGDVKVGVSVKGKTAEGDLDFRYSILPEKTMKISGVSPASAAPGKEITIYGDNFSVIKSENKVTFDGIEATVVYASETELRVIVPEHERGTAQLKVEVGGIFTVTMFSVKGLFIESNSPASGGSGIEVTIKGECFSPTAAENAVTLNNVPAEVKSATETELVVVTPTNPVGTYQFEITVGGKTVTGGSYKYAGTWTIQTVLGSLSEAITNSAAGQGLNARLYFPQDLTLGKDGNYWITVRNGDMGIYRMSPDFNLTKLVTASSAAILDKTFPWEGDVDSKGLYYFCGKAVGKLFTCDYEGNVVQYAVDRAIPNPMKLAIDGSDNIYLLSRGTAAGTGNIYKIKDNTVLRTYPLTTGLYEHITFSKDKKHIFIFGNSTWNILMLDLETGEMVNVAGNGIKPAATNYTDGEEGNPLTATVGSSEGAACAPDGTLYFGDITSNTIRKLTPDADGDYSKGTLETIAGTPFVKVPKDGIGTASVFEYPQALCLNPDGTLYVLDGTSHGTVRKVVYKL